MNSTGSHEDVGALIAGRYRVLQLLGRGGMAVVYRVVDERTGKELAIKRGAARDPHKLKRYAALLEREYYTLTQLAHPRIIEVYDYGLDAVGPYYTMELLDGKDLEDVERLPWRETCEVLCDVGSSLAMLHSRGFVHRDVTLRNIHFARDGHVKLIDFGAMSSMGVARDTVGTPAFLAPEALQMQALDARVDLFSLGALGYRLLTGRQAFPARRFSDLRDVWRSRPPSPHVLVPEIPAELSQLVLRLLTLDRGGRPQTAAEVIAALERLAGLQRENEQIVSRAYLTAPTLVGRETALLAVRRRMLALVRGEGGVLLVRGAVGTGRSRLLDACALEGKLLGAAVVRADSRDAASGEWGVARAIGTQLFELLPEQALEAARLSRHVLGSLVEGLREEEPLQLDATTVDPPERAVLMRELRDWALALIKQQRLLIIVDDIESSDDTSLAFISALAHRASHHHLLIVGALDTNDQGIHNAALRLVEDIAQNVDVADLGESEIEALMRSVFGEVANLSLCASRIYGLSHGNPRAAMALAQHLVDTGRARYEAGQWALPSMLDETDLPSSLAQALAAQLQELSEDARELAETLAIAADDNLDLTSYAKLTGHGDNKRLFGALNELCAIGILSAGLERYTFVQRSSLRLLQEQVPASRRLAAHVRVAQVLAAHGGDPLRRAHHLLAAELVDDALGLLSRIDLTAHTVPVRLLTAAVSAATLLGYPGSTLHRLRMAVLVHAPTFMDYESFHAVLPVVLRQLEQDSGLERYRELSAVPEAERLQQALTETHARYLATPERERVYTVVDAIRELSRLCGAMPAMAAPAFDVDMLESLPDLTPLYPLSPALPVLALLLEGGKQWIRGRMLRAMRAFEAVREGIALPDHAGLDDAQHDRTHMGTEFAIGLIEARLAMENAELRARALDQRPLLRVNALRIRTTYQLAMGNLAEARKHARRAELMQAQQGSIERFGATTHGMDLLLYANLGDTKGVLGTLRAVSMLARKHPGWRPVELLGRSRYAELQGDLAGALVLTREGIAELPHAGHPFYPMLAASEVRLLDKLGRVDEAALRADLYRASIQLSDHPAPDLELEASLAYAKLGRFEDAVAALDHLIAVDVRQGSAGMYAAEHYEARARVAIWMHDRAGFEHYAERAGREFEKAQNPDLSARVSQLYDEAHEQGVCPINDVLATMDLLVPSQSESQYESIHSRISECIDARDRAQCALTLLLQSTFSQNGWLFALDREAAPSLLAGVPGEPTDPRISGWVTQCALDWAATSESTETLEATRSATLTDTMDAEEHALYRYVDQEGHNLEAALLTVATENGRCLVAVLVMQITPPNRARPPEHLCTSVARALHDHGDVAGMAALD